MYWLDLGKVQEIEDMNIVSQMCAIAVMFVIMYFYISQKKIILHTSKAFVEVWIAGMLSLFSDIFVLVAIEKRSGYPLTATNIICKLYLWTVTLVAVVAFWYICVDIFRKKELERKWRKRLWIFGISIDILIMVVPIKIYDSDNIVYTYGPAVIITYAVTVILLALILLLTKKYSQAINPRRRKSMQVWVALMFISAVIQFIDKKILIVSFASVIGVLILFIMLENPMANIDRDTGFFNLNAFFEYMKEAYGQGNDVSIVCIRYGSNGNDFFTREMEKSIFDEVVSFINKLPDNYVFRSSANEYLLVFDNTDCAEKTIAILERRFDKPWGGDNMTMLFGEIYYLRSTELVRRPSDILGLFQYAKRNRAEFTGRGVMLINNEVIEHIYDENSVENEIIEALRDNRVEVFYQPIYNTKTHKFTSAEALVRIRSRDGNIIPPGRFIAVAEKRGLILSLGERVFEIVCRFIVQHDIHAMGIEYIECNLSVVQCAYDNLAQDFIAIMEKYHVDAKDIVLEITESASITEKKILLDNMDALRKVGVRFALDDFGTGQSNLSYIVDMPIDIVKFDRGMTNAYFDNGKGKPVMDAAMGMIQKLKLEIVSEGIEEKEQFAKLDELGIDYIQGYYFSKPRNAAEFISFIESNNA